MRSHKTPMRLCVDSPMYRQLRLTGLFLAGLSFAFGSLSCPFSGLTRHISASDGAGNRLQADHAPPDHTLRLWEDAERELDEISRLDRADGDDKPECLRIIRRLWPNGRPHARGNDKRLGHHNARGARSPPAA